MQTTGSSTLRSSCQSQLAIAPVSKPMRSASGAYLRSRLVRAPGSDLAFPPKIYCPVSLTTHTTVSLCETSSPTYCFMTAPPNRLFEGARCNGSFGPGGGHDITQ